MILRSIVLQHFRSYTQAKFDFDPTLTVIIGPNTAGKTNLTEAIQLLSSGKSFRGQSDKELVQFDQEIARVQGLVEDSEAQTTKQDLREEDYFSREQSESRSSSSFRLRSNNNTIKLEAVVLTPEANNGRWGKKYLVNGVTKSRNGFVGNLPLVAFRPEELDIVIAGPSLRRQFFDDVLETVDREYYLASIAYEKALRQRNALLDIAQETGRKNKQQFAYWDDLVIHNGQIIHEKRQEFIEYVHASSKDIAQFEIVVIDCKDAISAFPTIGTKRDRRRNGYFIKLTLVDLKFFCPEVQCFPGLNITE